MMNFRGLGMSIAITAVCIAGGWYLCSYSQRSVDPATMSEPILLLPDVKTHDGSNASASESDFFAEYSRARLLTSHAHYDYDKTQSGGPDILIEAHQVPLVSYDSVRMSLENRMLAPVPLAHMLMVVERRKHDRLQDAKVLGACRTHTSSTSVIPAAIVEVQETKNVYIVTAMKTTDGLEFQIHSLIRDSSCPDTWEQFTANPSAKYPDPLKSVASTRTKIPGLPSEVTELIATAVRKNDDLHLEIRVRGPSAESGDVLCRQSYSIKSNKWSVVPYPPSDSAKQYDANAPWQFESGSTKICAMLPLKEQFQGKLETQSTYVALVEQTYRYLPRKHGSVRALWVVACSPDGGLKDAVPFGVIHPECSPIGQGGSCCDLGSVLVCHPELDHCFVVTAGLSESRRGLNVFRCSLANPLVGQRLELTANPKKWPAQMEQICELPIHQLGFDTTLESASFNSNASEEDANLIVTMKSSNNWGKLTQQTCHYAFRNRQWTTTKQKLDARAGAP